MNTDKFKLVKGKTYSEAAKKIEGLFGIFKRKWVFIDRNNRQI